MQKKNWLKLVSTVCAPSSFVPRRPERSCPISSANHPIKEASKENSTRVLMSLRVRWSNIHSQCTHQKRVFRRSRFVRMMAKVTNGMTTLQILIATAAPRPPSDRGFLTSSVQSRLTPRQDKKFTSTAGSVTFCASQKRLSN